MADKQNGLSLREILSGKTVAELRELAKGCYVKGTSKLKKIELVCAVYDALNDPERLSELLYVIDESTWILFQRAAQSDEPVPINAAASQQYELLSELCYIKVSQRPDSEVCAVPVEIKELLDVMVADGFLGRKQRYDLLHRYALAATNLYGVISQDDFVELFNRQNQDKTTVDEVFQVLIRFIAVEADYCFWQEYLVSSIFEENDFRDVQDLLDRIGDKPRYIPDRKILLRYADWNYFERNEPTARLERYLQEQLEVPMLSIPQIISDIHFAYAVEAKTQQIVDILDEHHVKFNDQQFEPLVQLLADMSNSTRLWSNNGHTPSELSSIHENSLHRAMLTQKSAKVGRNDPCPCGSGKKYKKCCGR